MKSEVKPTDLKDLQILLYDIDMVQFYCHITTYQGDWTLTLVIDTILTFGYQQLRPGLKKNRYVVLKILSPNSPI